MDATGGASPTSTACISRRATTKASSTASARVCSDSSPARKASTRSAAASRRARPGHAIGCATWLSRAIADFLVRETRHVDAYMESPRRSRTVSTQRRRGVRAAVDERTRADREHVALAVGSDAADVFPPTGQRAHGTERPARRRRRSRSGAPARRVSRGIFPWYADGQPILWWSPDPRSVFAPNDFKVSRSLRRSINKGGLRVADDTAFATSSRAAPQPRGGSGATWITGKWRTPTAAPPPRVGAFVRDLARWPARRRPLRRSHRARVLRRIDVHARNRRVESDIGPGLEQLRGARLRAHRLSGRVRAHDEPRCAATFPRAEFIERLGPDSVSPRAHRARWRDS